jgi:hypothetical protein
MNILDLLKIDAALPGGRKAFAKVFGTTLGIASGAAIPIGVVMKILEKTRLKKILDSADSGIQDVVKEIMENNTARTIANQVSGNQFEELAESPLFDEETKEGKVRERFDMSDETEFLKISAAAIIVGLRRKEKNGKPKREKPRAPKTSCG